MGQSPFLMFDGKTHYLSHTLWCLMEKLINYHTPSGKRTFSYGKAMEPLQFSRGKSIVNGWNDPPFFMGKLINYPWPFSTLNAKLYARGYVPKL